MTDDALLVDLPDSGETLKIRDAGSSPLSSIIGAEQQKRSHRQARAAFLIHKDIKRLASHLSMLVRGIREPISARRKRLPPYALATGKHPSRFDKISGPGEEREHGRR